MPGSAASPNASNSRLDHLRPRKVLSASHESRRAIRLRVFEVALMRELVQDQVSAVRGIGCAAFRLVPRQHERSHAPATAMTLSLTCFSLLIKSPVASACRGFDEVCAGAKKENR